MLYQVPERSSTPGKPVLPLRQVNVLAIYAESCHEYRLSDPTAVTRGADRLDLNTCPPTEYGVLRTKRLLNTWNTGFAITTSQCSANLCWIKPWIQTFWSYCCDSRCWLTRSEYLSACRICSTKDHEAPQHLEIRFFRYGKSNVLAISAKSNHEYRHSDPTAVALRGDWLDLNTFQPAEYVVPRTRRLLNPWKTCFAVMASQCCGSTLTCCNAKTGFRGVEKPSGPW